MRALIILAALAALGCERDEALDRPLDAREPIVLQHHVAWSVPAQRELVLLRPGDLHLERVALPAIPTAVHPAPGGLGLLAVHGAGATWVPAADREPGPPLQMALGGDYRRAAFGPEGDRVVLFSEQGGGGATLSNPNQIAIVDLSTGAVTERTLRSYGSAPQAVVVAPAADGHQIAWLLAERYLAVLDLNQPEAREVVVHLVLRDDTREVTPLQVAFAEVDGAPTSFVRAEGSDDIFALTFPEAAAAGAVPRPYLNQLPAVEAPADLHVLEAFEGPRVFTCGGQQVAITHPVTGRRTVVAVGAPVDRILPFRATRGDDLTGEEEGQFALLWGQDSRAIVFADLDLLEHRGARALTPLVLSAPVTAVRPLPGRRGAVARLADVGLALLDFEARTATPLTANGRLESLVVEPDGERVHALVTDGGEASVVTVDADTGAAAATPLKAGGGALLFVPGPGRVVVDHRQRWGHVSVLGDDAVRRHEGYLLEGGFE